MFVKFRPEQSVWEVNFTTKRREKRGPYVRADAIFPRVPKNQHEGDKVQNKTVGSGVERACPVGCGGGSIHDFKHQTHVKSPPPRLLPYDRNR